MGVRLILRLAFKNQINTNSEMTKNNISIFLLTLKEKNIV